jgi:hypothetical protein
MAFVILIACLLSVIIISIVWPLHFLRGQWGETEPAHRGRRMAILLAAALVLTWPYLAIKGVELRHVLARVPAPLNIWWIDYRLERSWGIGLPGDNEEGFVVYRLASGSARWARSKGERLGEFLPGGAKAWHSTPVDAIGEHDRWHPYDQDGKSERHSATIFEYLGQYGYSIPIEAGRDADANQAINNPGSFYSYGSGGSVTIVDPARGKLYFAYAG